MVREELRYLLYPPEKGYCSIHQEKEENSTSSDNLSWSIESFLLRRRCQDSLLQTSDVILCKLTYWNMKELQNYQRYTFNLIIKWYVSPILLQY